MLIFLCNMVVFYNKIIYFKDNLCKVYHGADFKISIICLKCILKKRKISCTI